MANPGDRTQYTFTFTNADPDESVTFTARVYGAAAGREIGPRLELDADSSVTVWSDAAVLTAVTVDGQGLELRATATRDNPSITDSDGTAPVNSPHGTGTSVAPAVSTDSTGYSQIIEFTEGDSNPAISALVLHDAASPHYSCDGSLVTILTAGLHALTIISGTLGSALPDGASLSITVGNSGVPGGCSVTMTGPTHSQADVTACQTYYFAAGTTLYPAAYASGVPVDGYGSFIEIGLALLKAA